MNEVSRELLNNMRCQDNTVKYENNNTMIRGMFINESVKDEEGQ